MTNKLKEDPFLHFQFESESKNIIYIALKENMSFVEGKRLRNTQRSMVNQKRNIKNYSSTEKKQTQYPEAAK
jgi:hypothetical protein